MSFNCRNIIVQGWSTVLLESCRVVSDWLLILGKASTSPGTRTHCINFLDRTTDICMIYTNQHVVDVILMLLC